MLNDLIPLLTDEVTHLSGSARNIHGKLLPPTSDNTLASTHLARVNRVAGTVPTRLSQATMPQYSATVWLIDHPYPVFIGDRFILPGDAAPLDVIGVETRNADGLTLTKAFLK